MGGGDRCSRGGSTGRFLYTAVQHLLLHNNDFSRDPRLWQLGCALRGALLHGFTNGLSKALTWNIVSVVQQYELCTRHQVHICTRKFLCEHECCMITTAKGPSIYLYFQNMSKMTPLTWGVEIEVDLKTLLPKSTASKDSSGSGLEPVGYFSDTVTLGE